MNWLRISAYVILAILLLLTSGSASQAAESVVISPLVTAEGHDFSTLILSDPWDMDAYSDVSMYINESGTAIHLQNIQVSNGIFSAQSLNTNLDLPESSDAQFHVLFPGYRSSIHAGKTGARFPIDSTKYHCLFTRLKVNSSDTLDETRIWWFADDRLASVPEFGSGRISTFPFTSDWHFYGVDLNGFADVPLDWSAGTEWQGLRVDPTTKPGVDFEVDWVRLTDCTEVPVQISWAEISGEIEVWVGINGMQPDFMIPEGVLTLKNCSGNSCTLDVQGWEPGIYYIGVKPQSGGSIVWSSQPLTIDASPIVSFTRPSCVSGDSIRWEMLDESDILPGETRCVDYTFNSGNLDLTTLPPATIGSSCRSDGYSDPQIGLSIPVSLIDTNEYRYLSIRMSMNGAWQDVNKGWIARVVWQTPDDCFEVTNDIPFDTGWQTLVVDLHDPFEGQAEDFAPASCSLKHWTTDTTDFLRFDPNENDTTASMVQSIDWISLSKGNWVGVGNSYPIEVESSEPIQEGSVTLFYTSDIDVPKQNLAVITPDMDPQGPYFVYLPLLMGGIGAGGGDTLFYWDTTDVSPGSYYICGEFPDGLNSPVFCSRATILVQ